MEPVIQDAESAKRCFEATKAILNEKNHPAMSGMKEAIKELNLTVTMEIKQYIKLIKFYHKNEDLKTLYQMHGIDEENLKAFLDAYDKPLKIDNGDALDANEENSASGGEQEPDDYYDEEPDDFGTDESSEADAVSEKSENIETKGTKTELMDSDSQKPARPTSPRIHINLDDI